MIGSLNINKDGGLSEALEFFKTDIFKLILANFGALKEEFGSNFAGILLILWWYNLLVDLVQKYAVFGMLSLIYFLCSITLKVRLEDYILCSTW